MNAKNLKCLICGESFGKSGLMKRYIKAIHEGKEITNVILVEKSSVDQEV